MALVIFANAVGLILFLQGRADRLLAALFDPMHPAWDDMQRAFAAFTLYAVPLIASLVVGALFGVRLLRAEWVKRRPPASDNARKRVVLPMVTTAVALTAAVVLVFIEVLIFQDYGIHFYEFDVVGILADAALRRDLGIQPAEVARVTGFATALLAGELALCFAAIRLAAWRNGALARACTTAMVVCIPGGYAMFASQEQAIGAAQPEFEAALPLGRPLLLRSGTGAHIPVRPRLGDGGYPVADSGAVPRLSRTPNILFFVPDGLRADMVRPELTPNLLALANSRDAIHSGRHYSTGHVSEAGIFGLLYGLNGHAFNAFLEHRVPPYPLSVLKRNGYHTCFISSSRLNPWPTDELIQVFDEVSYPANDDEAVQHLKRYLDARRADGKPWFVLAFFYTPHFPFTSAKPHLRKFPNYGPKARTNYMNDVIQADEYLRQVLQLVGQDTSAVILATSDHGEEIREHGAFGHASPTFWNEKVQVPFVLRLPGSRLAASGARPPLSSHVDLWPTLFDYLGAAPRLAPEQYSDGRSLLDSTATVEPVFVAGRFFPYAERPSMLADRDGKYWFNIPRLGAGNRLCIDVTRVTDPADAPLDMDVRAAEQRPAFDALQRSFWRFLTPDAGPQPAPC